MIRDVNPGAPSLMGNPWAPQRREPLSRALMPIPDRVAANMPRRETRGDLVPIRGFVRYLSNGSPGGRPIDPPTPLLAPLGSSPMERKARVLANRERNFAEREIQAKRFLLTKEKVTLMQLGKPFARDAATSFRFKPSYLDKPAPPSGYHGGETRAREVNRQFPKDTSLSMVPLSTLGGSSWTLSPSSFNHSSLAARLPKTL